jgi:hypothetical protein
VHVDVVEHEAAAVQVDHHALGGGVSDRSVEAAADAVGVEVPDLGDLLARLLGRDPQRLGAGGGDVVPLRPDGCEGGRLLDGAAGVREQHDDPG